MDGQYYLPLGAINIVNAEKVEIEGIQFQFNNDNGFARDVGPFLDGILIDSCDQVIFKNNTITDVSNWGLRIRVSDDIEVTHNVIDSCLLGGMGITAVEGGVIGWNDVSNNGVDAPANGYGISLTHQFGTWQSNENITIIGNQCDYNLRKGIDMHGGNNIVITGNTIKGFVDKGISAYSSGDFEYGHVDEIVDVTIIDNMIENDSTWYSNITWGYSASGYDEPYAIGIGVGTYYWGKPVSGEGAGNIIVSGNKMKNLTVFQGDTLVSFFAIRVYTGNAHTVQISNNIIDTSKVMHGISAADGNYESYVSQTQNLDITGNSFTQVNAEGAGDVAGRIILATGGENINISNNKLIECSAYGGHGINVIQVTPNIIKHVKVNNNHIDADTTEVDSVSGIGIGIYVRHGDFQVNNNTFSGHILTRQCISLWVTLEGTAMNNSYFGSFLDSDTMRVQSLPDYSSPTSGKLSTVLHRDTTTAADTITTMMVNAGTSYPYAINGSASFHITITVSSNATPEQGVYEYYAWAKNDTSGQDTELDYVDSVEFSLDTLSSTILEGSEDYPTVVWANIGEAGGTTGRLRALNVYCDKTETTYAIEVKFQGYRLKPHYLVY